MTIDNNYKYDKCRLVSEGDRKMRKLAMVAVLVALCFIVAPTMAAGNGNCDGDGIQDLDGTGPQIGSPGNFNENGDHDGEHQPDLDGEGHS
jgi:hypothetical protein